MTKRISRRKFLQMGGLAGTAVALSGCTISLQKPEYLDALRRAARGSAAGSEHLVRQRLSPVSLRLWHPRARQQRSGAQDRG